MMEVPMHRVNVVAVVTIVVHGVLAGFAIPAAAQAVTAFEGARLIVGDGRVIENAALMVDGTKIAQAGKAADVRVPAGATRVNLAGKTVMPMIIDTHVHLSPTREPLLRDLRGRAYWGVSAVLSMGTDGYEVLGVHNEVIPGAARYLSAGRGITAPEPGRTTAPYWVTSAAEGRKAVDELAAHKVDIVKIWVDTREGKYKKLTPEMYGDIDDEFVAMFKAHPKLVLTPNLPDRGVKVDLGWLRNGITPEEFAKLEKANTDRPDTQAFYGIQARNLKRLNAAGAFIVLGSDGNRPWGPHEEMRDMVIAGMTPMQVIVAATRNSAEYLRLDGGTLQAGKSADFIVLDANPLDDITNTRRISQVILRGAPVDRSQP